MKSNDQLDEKVKMSIERLRSFEPEEGYHLSFSGGKDSVVLKVLADMAGVKYRAVYRVTSVDPPELVTFIKEKHPDVIRDIPKDSEGKPITMWNLIPKKKLPPTRIMRYCCQYLKESAGDGKKTLTGVRWEESFRRSQSHGVVTIADKRAASEFADSEDFQKTPQGGIVLVNDNTGSRRMVESCYRRHKTMVNPIIDWTTQDVWTFIKSNGIPYCKLYDEGYKRLGCIGCPMASRREREREMIRWPTYRKAYIRSFEKLLKVYEENGKQFTSPHLKKKAFITAIDVYDWWLGYDELEGQMDLFREAESEA